PARGATGSAAPETDRDLVGGPRHARLRRARHAQPARTRTVACHPVDRWLRRRPDVRPFVWTPRFASGAALDRRDVPERSVLAWPSSAMGRRCPAGNLAVLAGRAASSPYGPARSVDAAGERGPADGGLGADRVVVAADVRQMVAADTADPDYLVGSRARRGD